MTHDSGRVNCGPQISDNLPSARSPPHLEALVLEQKKERAGHAPGVIHLGPKAQSEIAYMPLLPAMRPREIFTLPSSSETVTTVNDSSFTLIIQVASLVEVSWYMGSPSFPV